MPTEKINSTNGVQSKERVQCNHLLLDVDFFAKPKIKQFSMKFGNIARLWLVDMLLDMSRATNATIEIELAELTASNLGLDNGKEIISYCLSKGILQQESEGTITCQRVIDDQVSLADKRRAYADRQKKSRVSHECHASVTRDSRDSLNTELLNTELLNTELLNTELLNTEVKEGGAGETISTESPEASEALRRWGEYTQKTLKKPWDQIQAEALIMRYHGRNSDFIRDVNGSISSGWRAVRDCADLAATRPRAGPNGAKSKEEIDKERKKIIEAMERGFE